MGFPKALYERCAALGLFSEGGPLAPPPARRPLRVVSLGGGPGYELLAFEWYWRYFHAVACLWIDGGRGAAGCPSVSGGNLWQMTIYPQLADR